MKRIRSSYSRTITFGDFVINPNETKILPEGLEIPEQWKSHLEVIEEVEKKEKKVDKLTRTVILENAEDYKPKKKR